MTSVDLTSVRTQTLLDAWVRKPNFVNIWGLFQRLLGKSSQQQHRGQKKNQSHTKTKDTSQDRVQSEVTVSIECEKGNVKTRQGAQAKWWREKKEGKTKQRVELDTWCKNQNTNFFSLNANQKGKGEEGMRQC